MATKFVLCFNSFAICRRVHRVIVFLDLELEKCKMTKYCHERGKDKTETKSNLSM